VTVASRAQLTAKMTAGLEAYETAEGPLPDFTVELRDSLVGQLVDSARRNLFIDYLCRAHLSASVTDPRDDRFDPLRAAIFHHRAGNDDEAFWMLFLFVHFGKNLRSDYAYARAVYGALGTGPQWTWQRVATDLAGFRSWLHEHGDEVKRTGGGFGNHRKYESLDAWSGAGTGAVVASYVAWVGDPPAHRRLFDDAVGAARSDPERAFHFLYGSMRKVHRFGRIGCFDYLSMAGKVGLADIQPGMAYFQDSSGPRKGAQLLFEPGAEKRLPSKTLEARAATFRGYLDVPFDVIEDALCNWQKSPTVFRPFRG